jgi:hypothetical protein
MVVGAVVTTVVGFIGFKVYELYKLYSLLYRTCVIMVRTIEQLDKEFAVHKETVASHKAVIEKFNR